MSKLHFHDRVVVITGAGNGLGRAYAHLLAARGARVVVNDIGVAADENLGAASAAEVVAAEITRSGGTAVADHSDISTPNGGRAVVQKALDTFGSLDVLINNAGILRDGTLHKMTQDSFDSVVSVHLRGAFCVSQPAFAHMRENGHGRIVNTTSAAGLYGNFGQVNYSSAKMGLVGMTRSIAAEGSKHDIKANVIAPVSISRLTEGLMSEAMSRLSPEQVAPVVAYLAHESCRLSGRVLSAYGGQVKSVFIAETRGFSAEDLTVEDVAANLDRILDQTGFTVPDSAKAAFEL
ncbi:SDR family NAD(P)-dependent oxidoreductase [Mycobacterium sp. NPDC003449]